MSLNRYSVPPEGVEIGYKKYPSGGVADSSVHK
jgi:hypothetical protein